MQEHNACYSINRKKGYVTVYNTNTIFPLPAWNEYRTQHDMTHQELANLMAQCGPRNDTPKNLDIPDTCTTCIEMGRSRCLCGP